MTSTRPGTLGVQSSGELDTFYATSDPWGYDTHPDDRRRVEHILLALPKGVPDRVLDIGCGSGYLTTRLPGREVTGIDLSPAAINWARQRARGLGRVGMTFETGSVLNLDALPAHRFDLVVITGVLYRQYIGDAFTSVSESILRRLTPGGHLVHAHIDSWFRHGFPLNRVAVRRYPYRDYVHRLEVYAS